MFAGPFVPLPVRHWHGVSFEARERREGRMKERMYEIEVFPCDEKTGERKGPSEIVSAEPMTHREACVVLSKWTQRRGRRVQLREVV